MKQVLWIVVLFDLFLDTPGKVLNIAHRGVISEFPENTMPAFRAAAEMNVDMIELDVQLSKDGVPVVHHDAKLKPYSTHKGFIKDYTSDEIEQIELTIPEKGHVRMKVPKLEEVLKFARGKIPLNIEIKKEAVTNELESGAEQKCLQLVEKYGMKDQVLFSSFDLRVIQHINQLNSGIATAVLYSSQPYQRKLPSQIVRHYNADAFHCTYYQLSYKWAKDLKSNHIPVIVYTVNSASKMRSLIDLEVNGIISDKPILLREIINKY